METHSLSALIDAAPLLMGLTPKSDLTPYTDLAEALLERMADMGVERSRDAVKRLRQTIENCPQKRNHVYQAPWRGLEELCELAALPPEDQQRNITMARWYTSLAVFILQHPLNCTNCTSYRLDDQRVSSPAVGD